MTDTKAVILDRDGVINLDSSDYVKSAGEWSPIAGSPEAIARLTHAGYRVFVATNQAGIARGVFTTEHLIQMHEKMVEITRESGGEFTGIYFCPHHPDDNCACRKPRPGMLQQIAQDHDLDLNNLPFVGDSVKDIEAAEAAGCRPVLVLTGNGEQTRERRPDLSDVFKNLSDFVDALLGNQGSSD